MNKQQQRDDQTRGQPDESGTNPVHRPVADHEETPDPVEHAETMPSDEPRQLAQEPSGPIVKICKTCMTSRRGAGDYCVECGRQLDPIRSVQDTCVGDVVGDKYTIVEKIGAGGMGQVYLGLNEPLGQRVAIKFLNEKFTSDEDVVLRFLNEARSYCKVSHPNAVTLLEYGQHDNGALYLITEYVDGTDLTHLVDDKGPLPLDMLTSIGLQLCEVLSAAHDQEVIHRDLKPDNLMLIPGSRDQYALKVLDFGIAKIADDNVEGPMTETGSVFGTPEFMSPEQARGKGADPRTDLYALGAILYFMTTGQLPFTGDSKFEILNQQLHEAPQPPSNVANRPVPRDLEVLIFECLEKSPDGRPDSAAEVADRLEAIDPEDVASPDPAAEPAAGSSSTGPTKILDGPAAEDEVGPLDDTVFDDQGASSVEINMKDELDPPGGGPEMAFDDESGGELETSFETSETGHEEWTGEFGDPGTTDIPLTGGAGGPGRLRSAALGLAATAMVVGGVLVWSVLDDDHSPDQAPEPEAVAQQAEEATGQARALGVISTADALLEAGDLADVDELLETVDPDGLSSGLAAAYDERVQRASRAQNTEMQLKSAVEARDCETAQSLHDRLGQLSPGAADERGELLDQCDELDRKDEADQPERDTPAVADRGSRPENVESPDPPESNAGGAEETVAQGAADSDEQDSEPTADAAGDGQPTEIADATDTGAAQGEQAEATGEGMPTDDGAAPDRDSGGAEPETTADRDESEDDEPPTREVVRESDDPEADRDVEDEERTEADAPDEQPEIAGESGRDSETEESESDDEEPETVEQPEVADNTEPDAETGEDDIALPPSEL